MDVFYLIIEAMYQFLFAFFIYCFFLSSRFPITGKGLDDFNMALYIPITCIGVIGAYVASELGYFYYRTIAGYASIFVIVAPIYYIHHRRYKRQVNQELNDKYGS
ncbi:hypothetical protein [Vibrio sp. 10N]|uniref:hypothetical protein n=1 Tax=Vibrio sp. 10N TaxID=3058938 RepID=UPI0028145B0D|nr:hypothetical protein VB10N_36700 [Vibrio sp. 10N]